ncbi:MAG: hypothetical protein M3O03_12215 [Pseudomonadota bacterium]|nr:hypothetical protein [Pseudomonadota bacterium]
MMLGYSKEIAVTLQVMKNGVGILVDVECVAHVDYGAPNGEMEWEVTGLEFQNYEFANGKREVTGKTVIDKSDGPLFNILMSGLDEDQIAESVAEEFSFSRDDDSGYVNSARVLA